MGDSTIKDPAATVLAMLEEARLQAARAAGLDAAHPHPLPGLPAREAEAALDLSPEEMLEECAREPETDIGNARRFLIRYGDRVLYVARVGWHGYDGRRWKEDEDGSVVRPLAQRAAEFIDDEAVLLDGKPEEQQAIEDGKLALEERQALGRPKEWTAELTAQSEAIDRRLDRMAEAKKAIKGRMSSRHSHAKSAAGTTKINNMLTEAAPHVAKTVNEMNTDLYAFNCESGTIRFVRVENEESDPDDPTFEWRVRLDGHDYRDMISKLAPVAFSSVPVGPSAVFDVFLKTIMPDADIRSFLKRFFGYCLLGITSEQCLLFFYGAGRNGKSTLVDLMCEILGDYAVTLSIDSFAGDTRRGGAEATPDLARLPGARFVAAAEPEMGVKIKDALIKALTGGEKLPIRRLHQDFIDLIPQFKIVLSGNHKPVITDDSDGIWRRVHMVPFDVQIAQADVDRDLPKKLRAEKAAIFAWIVAGALEYLNYGLSPPARVLAATAEYREESDPIGAFIRNACVVTGQERDEASVEDLVIGYANYARKEGLPEFKASTFSRRFPDQCRKSWTAIDGTMRQFWKAKSGTTVYRGIVVKTEYVAPAGGSGGPDDNEGHLR